MCGERETEGLEEPALRASSMCGGCWMGGGWHREYVGRRRGYVVRCWYVGGGDVVEFLGLKQAGSSFFWMRARFRRALPAQSKY